MKASNQQTPGYGWNARPYPQQATRPAAPAPMQGGVMIPGKAPASAQEQTPVNKALRETTYLAGGMEVTLSPDVVRRYLVSGQPEKVTMQEVVMFINLCKFSGLNPWLKEAYCIKFGDKPATLVAGIGAFIKRADAHPQYDGMSSGCIVLNEETGEVRYSTGAFHLPAEKIVGGWAEVKRKDRSCDTHTEVTLEEYIGRRKDGQVNDQWRTRPATMIRKVAMAQALREAFPSEFRGLYTADEMGVDEGQISETPVEPVAPGPCGKLEVQHEMGQAVEIGGGAPAEQVEEQPPAQDDDPTSEPEQVSFDEI